jgi:crotonobetainyl-CoA:carnitine CoA-transferase CaiB-like acyl-CoA transferase
VDDTHPLGGVVVLDLSSGIPGAYCSKLLADGGADTILAECPEGNPLRRWSTSSTIAPPDDGALFQFLASSKRSVVADPGDAADIELVGRFARSADIIVWTRGSRLAEHAAFLPRSLRELAPRAVVAAITPFGLDGPWADRPATEFTLQAWAGGIIGRGASMEQGPAHVSGRPGEWLGGLFGAVAALTSYQRAHDVGVGELIDVSMLEVLALTMNMYPLTARTMTSPTGNTFRSRERRNLNIPALERTADGWVGFMVATAVMWEAFCTMVGHPDWLQDESLYSYAGRAARRQELEAGIRTWCASHTSDEIIELATLLRVPVAPIGNGKTIPAFDHFMERNFYVTNPRAGFVQPDVPYTLGDNASRRSVEASPLLGEHTGTERAHTRPRRTTVHSSPSGRLPFEGLRVADFTAFWAGPIVGHYLAMLGAEVVHVESVKRPDGIRGHSVLTPNDPSWWEWSPLFHGSNTNKRGLTLDLNTEEGQAIAREFIAECDVVLENYSPRVMEQWGLTYERLTECRSDLIMVRMPAFGLSGPWRERTGYAQNMEQVSGMAWVTGYPDGPPLLPNGMCDPVAGTHATFSLLLALEYRRRTGRGMLVEVAMVGGALNIAAEQVIEWSAYGELIERDGNRGPTAAPQNLYRTSDIGADGVQDTWVAIAIENDLEWKSLVAVLGHPGWSDDSALDSVAGRRAAHDEIDNRLGQWCGRRTVSEIVEALWPAGVPVAAVVDGATLDSSPQFVARRFFETVVHPITGEQVHAGYPVRFEAGPHRFHRAPAPTLGQDNQHILGELLHRSAEDLAALEDRAIIGTRLLGEHRTR